MEQAGKHMDGLKTYAQPLGRLLMSSFFIWAGISNLNNMSGRVQYLASVHVPLPDIAVWVVMAIHLIGGLLILVGYQTRWAALVLAIYCLITAFGAHLRVGDAVNMTYFYKDLVMAGGFLYVFSVGAGALSIDGQSSSGIVAKRAGNLRGRQDGSAPLTFTPPVVRRFGKTRPLQNPAVYANQPALDPSCLG
jgi:putative oxidoreductase